MFIFIFYELHYSIIYPIDCDLGFSAMSKLIPMADRSGSWEGWEANTFRKTSQDVNSHDDFVLLKYCRRGVYAQSIPCFGNYLFGRIFVFIEFSVLVNNSIIFIILRSCKRVCEVGVVNK